MTTTYTLTAQTITGQIQLQYVDGSLNAIKMALKEPLSDKQFRALLDKLSPYERDIKILEDLRLTITQDAPTNVKIAMFCDKYMQHIGNTFKPPIKYSVHPADTGKIKTIKIDEPMLDVYFTTDHHLIKDKHSISNLVRHYNTLKLEVAKASAPKARFIDHFSQQYQDKLSGAELSAYWQHLNALGWKPVKNGRGAVTDWVKG